MNAAMMEPAAGETLPYDAEPILAGHAFERRGEQPVAPYRRQQAVHTERRCPVCGRRYAARIAVCPIDAARLDPAETHVQPFLWLG